MIEFFSQLGDNIFRCRLGNEDVFVSYLDLPRLHFAGIFLANPSTINNAIENYSPTIVYNNNPPSDTNPNSVWWNPMGQAFFKVPSATITGAEGATPVAPNDPVFNAQMVSVITGAINAQYARLVDLDPDQQAASLVVGLALKISAASGISLTGVVRPMCIQDLWSRIVGGTAGGIGSAGCMYQSVLENLQWSGVSGTSTLLGQLRAASPEMLSIKFMVDSYNGDITSPTFAQGRIVGTIGPYCAGEPVSFLAQRRMFAGDPGAPSAPVLPVSVNNSPMNSAPFQLKGNTLTIDLGNAVPLTAPNGPSLDLGAVQPVIDPAGQAIVLAPLFSTPAQFDALYRTNAGIFDIDVSANAELLQTVPLALQINPPSAAVALVTGKPLARMKEGISLAESGATPVLGTAGAQYGASERTDGILVDRAFNALRLEAGAPAWSAAALTGTEITSTAQVTLTATRWGNPAANLTIGIATTPNQSQFRDNTGTYQNISNVPLSSIAWSPQNGQTDASGQLVVTFTAQGLPSSAKPAERVNIDGQMYMFAYDYFMGGVQPINFLMFEDTMLNPNPVWADIQPILAQYMRLYPAMKSLIDLSDYATVTNPQFGVPTKIQGALSLPMSHPAFMPVTRDLSLGKRNLLLLWFKNGMPQALAVKT
jgi:hypothetical protein